MSFAGVDAVAIAVLTAPVMALVAWGLVRIRRARAAIRAAVERQGLEMVGLEHRLFRLGPLFSTTTRSQIVYRLVVRESTGRQRTGWARWGRSWLGTPDVLELRWDE